MTNTTETTFKKKCQILSDLWVLHRENEKYKEAVKYFFNNANATSDFIGADVFSKLKKVKNYNEFEKAYYDSKQLGEHTDQFKKGGCMYSEGGEITGKYALVSLGGSIGSKVKHPVYVNSKVGSIIATSDDKEELTNLLDNLKEHSSNITNILSNLFLQF